MNKSILRIAAVFLLASAGSLAAFGQDLGQIVLGKNYNLKAMNSVSGTIKAPSTGYLLQKGGTAFEYTDTSNGEIIFPEHAGYCDNGSIWSIPVTENTVYNMSSSFVLDDYTVMWVMEGALPLELTSTLPAQGSTISTSVNDTGDILLTFSEPVIYESAHIVVGNNTIDIDIDNMMMRNVPLITKAVRISSAMRTLYNSGILDPKGGTPLTLVVEGISSIGGSTYGSDGSLSLNFVAAHKSLEMVSTTFPDTGAPLLSYYPEGSPEGIFTITLDGEIAVDSKHAPYAEFVMGDVSIVGAHVYELIPVTVEGNVITLDMTGVNRRPAISAANGIGDGDPCAIKIASVYDKSFSPAEGNSQGALGSFSFSFTYSEVPQQPINYEFTPANGSFLKGISSIELWLDNFSVIQSWDGILFTYDNGTTELIAAESLVNESDEPGEALFNITVPSKAKNNPVTVSMANIISRDGYDKMISASYNKFVVTYSTPFVEGATLESIPADPYLTGSANAPISKKLVHIRTNFYERYPDLYIWYEVYDTTANRYVQGTYMSHLGDGEYAGAWLPYNYNLVAGHTYTATFYAWENEGIGSMDDRRRQTIGKHVITFFGAGEGFTYSPIVFESITPDPTMGPITPDQNTITVTYDGIVKINEQRSGILLGMGAGIVPFQSIEPVDADPENNGFSSVWQLTIPEYIMSNESVDMSIAAYDENGLTVEGDMATNDNTDYKSFSFSINNPDNFLPLTTSPASNDTVEKIQTIKISNDEYPIGINWNCIEPIVIFNTLGEFHNVVRSDRDDTEIVNVIETIGVDEETGDPIYDENGAYCLITLKEPITEAGTYTVVIPAEYFTIGTQFVNYRNAETTITLTVEPEVQTPSGDVDGDGKITVTDVVIICNAILGNPGEGFNEEAADLNGDNKITIADVVILVNKIISSVD